MSRWYLNLIGLLLLAACATPRPVPASAPPPVQAAVATPPVTLPPPAQCALFAREFTGIHIRGDAWTWWDQARGRYPRGSKPRESTILVLRSTRRLKLGHVAIVRRIVGPREITVTHANWGHDDPTRRIIHDATPVVDVSPKNDWTELRFWNANNRSFGQVYAAYGFIYPRAFTADSAPVW